MKGRGSLTNGPCLFIGSLIDQERCLSCQPGLISSFHGQLIDWAPFLFFFDSCHFATLFPHKCSFGRKTCQSVIRDLFKTPCCVQTSKPKIFSISKTELRLLFGINTESIALEIAFEECCGKCSEVSKKCANLAIKLS